MIKAAELLFMYIMKIGPLNSLHCALQFRLCFVQQSYETCRCFILLYRKIIELRGD
ncbi:hypothetical protein IMSAG049_00619 [Clostridiales bacterium]|nr:hypothetical protein IMSAG049_00619 [Clostridiales bacterium]